MVGALKSDRITNKIGNYGMSSEPRNPENQQEVSELGDESR